MRRKVLVGIVLACLILGMIPIPVATEENTCKPMSLHFPDRSSVYKSVEEQNAPQAIRVSPSSSTVPLAPGKEQTFRIRATDEDGDIHMVQWEVNGEWEKTDSLATLNAPNLEGSADFSYTFEDDSIVEAIVYDKEMNEDIITWSVKMGEAPTIISYTQVPSNPVGSEEVYYVVTYKNDEQDDGFVTLDIQNGNKVVDKPIDYVKGPGQLNEVSKAAIKGNMAAMFENVLEKVDLGLLDFFNDYLGQDLDSFLEVEDAIGFKIFSQVYSNDDYDKDYAVKVIVEDGEGKDSKSLTTKVREYYIHILKEEIEDKNPDKDGIQGIVEIPFDYNLPPQYKYLWCWVEVNGETIPAAEDAKVREPTELEGKGRESIWLTSHLFKNGDTTIKIVADTPALYAKTYSGEESLDFQNDVGVMNWEDKFSEWGMGDIIFGGEWNELGHADITEDELTEYFGGPYEHVTEVNKKLFQRGFYDITFLPDEDAGEFEFVGNVEKKKEEWLPLVEIGSLIVGFVLFPPHTVAHLLIHFAGHKVIFTGGEEIYKVTQPGNELQYKGIPSGDLEGNVYLLFVRTSAKQNYVNGVVRYLLVYPFYLSQRGIWDFPTQEIVEGYPEIYSIPAITTIMNEGTEWDPTADCIEWKPTTIKEGETKSYNLKIKKNVLPNINTGSMRLELDIPKGLEISNLKVKDADDANFKKQNFVEVDTELAVGGTGYCYILSNKPTVRGEKHPTFPSGTRVIINIHNAEAMATTQEEVIFDLKANSEGPFDIKYGLIPGERTAGEYARVRCDESEYPNPITYTQPPLVSYYWYRTLIKSIHIDSPSIDEDIFPPEIDFDTLLTAISDFFEAIISALSEIVITLKEKTISVPPEEKAIENVENALGALASMADAYSEFMQMICELSEVKPSEYPEMKLNYHVLSSKLCNSRGEASTYMSSKGIESRDISDALDLVRELKLEKNGFCIVIVDYSFIGFGEKESGRYPIVCNEKGDPFWESWQFYEKIKGEIEEAYKEYK